MTTTAITKALAAATAVALLAIVAAGCGGDDEGSGNGGGVITADGSSTVGPFVTKAAAGLQGRGGRRRHGRHLGHRRRLRALLRRRDRSLERVTPDRRGGDRALRGGRHRVRRVPHRHRRAHQRRERRERLGDVPDDRTAEGDLGARLEGRATGTRSTRRSPTCRSACTGPGPTPGRSTTSRMRSTARRARAAPTSQPSEDDNVIVQGVSGERAASATSASRTTSRTRRTLKALEVDGGIRVRRAERRDGAERHVHAALASAVRVREAELVRRQRGRARLHRSTCSTTTRRSPRRRCSCR